MKEWNGKHVVILGAARQGLALARWLTQHGAKVTLSDKRTVDELPSFPEMLSGIQIQFELGGHPLKVLDHADTLCLSGGVPTNLPIIATPRLKGRSQSPTIPRSSWKLFPARQLA